MYKFLLFYLHFFFFTDFFIICLLSVFCIHKVLSEFLTSELKVKTAEVKKKTSNGNC